MPQACTAIEISGLVKAYGRRMALRDVSVRILEGEAVALMGANGAGKTTLLRCIASTARPTAGDIRCFGASMRQPWGRSILGVVGHDSRLYPNLTLRENLYFAARVCGVREADRSAAEWLRRFGLAHYADRMPQQVSRGMRQRASLARACIHQPRILLLDEPFTGLDADGRQSLIGLFRDLKQQQRTICFAVHDRSLAELLADRVLTIEGGRIATDERLRGALAEVPLPSRAA